MSVALNRSIYAWKQDGVRYVAAARYPIDIDFNNQTSKFVHILLYVPK